MQVQYHCINTLTKTHHLFLLKFIVENSIKKIFHFINWFSFLTENIDICLLSQSRWESKHMSMSIKTLITLFFQFLQICFLFMHTMQSLSSYIMQTHLYLAHKQIHLHFYKSCRLHLLLLHTYKRHVSISPRTIL